MVVLLGIEHIFTCFQYPLCLPSWTEFTPTPRQPLATSKRSYFGQDLVLVPAPLAAPAILSFLALSNANPRAGDLTYPAVLLSEPPAPKVSSSFEWESDWARCLSLGRSHLDVSPSKSFKPCSLEGAWEGVFTVRRIIFSPHLVSECRSPVHRVHGLRVTFTRQWAYYP